jgi:hypothetical protein
LRAIAFDRELLEVDEAYEKPAEAIDEDPPVKSPAAG